MFVKTENEAAVHLFILWKKSIYTHRANALKEISNKEIVLD
jgi:hypothetical protein